MTAYQKHAYISKRLHDKYNFSSRSLHYRHNYLEKNSMSAFYPNYISSNRQIILIIFPYMKHISFGCLEFLHNPNHLDNNANSLENMNAIYHKK